MVRYRSNLVDDFKLPNGHAAHQPRGPTTVWYGACRCAQAGFSHCLRDATFMGHRCQHQELCTAAGMPRQQQQQTTSTSCWSSCRWAVWASREPVRHALYAEGPSPHFSVLVGLLRPGKHAAGIDQRAAGTGTHLAQGSSTIGDHVKVSDAGVGLQGINMVTVT